ncbi:hypothetical protein C474_15219 [Halogeometricum pallidum JCM 14848]|uniref:Small CPxCG-related zinc finger protein n=1 Tax=Halogeometricum pallidum JCM 14848 TaxID=1227487 RepID=M0CZ26_HALPD|nr:HVO_2142 family zinc finger protein [Halogeometricum pallidum]ELZ28470.1 hypothetical protein C474_15219 [Halogeometricum pallidum JCM 14848]
MSLERPQDVPPEWCPDCGDELLFSGTQSAGYAQFFCQNCRYRHDVYVGCAASGPATDDSVTASGDR